MQFLIVAFDGTDEGALARRLAVRDAHLALGDKLVASGNMLYGAAILNEEGKMKGSTLMMDFPSEKELQDWLDQEPYVTGKVWENIQIHKCSTRNPWQFNRPKEFFDVRENSGKK